MYIVLNYKLNFSREQSEFNYFEISSNSNKMITLDSFDIVELSKIVKNNYLLGEDIHVYCLNKNTFEKNINEMQDKITYKFQVKSEVDFKILKESSNYKNQNTFMVYRFCSMIEDLIYSNRLKGCVNRLVESLDFKTLLEISNYLKNLPKNINNLSSINNAIEKIEEKALIKSFEVNCIELEDIIELLSYDCKCKNLILSRIKIHLYSRYVDFNILEKEINMLVNIPNKQILHLLSEDYVNKLILLYSTSNEEKKDVLKKCESILRMIINFLDTNSFDSSKITEQHNFLLKQNRRLLF